MDRALLLSLAPSIHGPCITCTLRLSCMAEPAPSFLFRLKRQLTGCFRSTVYHCPAKAHYPQELGCGVSK